MPRGVHNSRRGPKPRAPEEASARRLAATRRAARKHWRKKHPPAKPAKRCARSRALLPEVSWAECVNAGLSITRKQHAALYWMDTSGKLHREDKRTAEEVIEQWQDSQKKKSPRS